MRRPSDRCERCGLDRGFHGPLLAMAGDIQCEGFVERRALDNYTYRGDREDAFANAIRRTWHMQVGGVDWIGATDGKVMVVRHGKCPRSAHLAVREHVVDMLAGKAEATVIPVDREDLRLWCDDRWFGVEVLGVHVDPELVAAVLDSAPWGDVHVRSGGGAAGPWLDLCAPGWAARVMALKGECVPVHVWPPVEAHGRAS